MLFILDDSHIYDSIHSSEANYDSVNEDDEDPSNPPNTDTNQDSTTVENPYYSDDVRVEPVNTVIQRTENPYYGVETDADLESTGMSNAEPEEVERVTSTENPYYEQELK